MKYFIFLFFILIAVPATSQILNVESLRKVTDTSGFTGSASMDFSLKKDANEYFGLQTNIHVQYKMNKHLVLLKNDLEFQKVEGNKFANKGISHLRYNYKLFPKIRWEAFVQAQYNKVSKVNFRGLLGTGPRFKLSESENYNVYLGTLIMYEQEELEDDITPIQCDIRGSGYLSFSLYPTSNITVVSTTYYQPKLAHFSDFRISSQTSLLIKMFEDFSFKSSYTYIYDQFPAVGIPKTQYNFSSGVVYTFG